MTPAGNPTEGPAPTADEEVPGVDARVLGKLLLAQSTLHVMDDLAQLASFLCACLTDIPGVSEVGACLWDRSAPGSHRPQDRCGCLSDDGRAGPPAPDGVRIGDLACSSEDVNSIAIETGSGHYGFLHFAVSDPRVFGPYHAYVGNTANLVALVVENREQERELRDHQHSLETMVRDRTAELERSTSRYRGLFEEMSQGVVCFGADARITAVNPAAERILGVSAADLIGIPASREHWGLVDLDGEPIPEEEYPANRAFRTRETVESAVVGVFHGRPPRRRWLRVHAVPLFREGDTSPYEVHTTFDDITEEIRAAYLEDQLRHARKMESLGTLAGGIAHDFNNLLTAIVGYAELLDREHSPGSTGRRSVDGILSASQRATGLTRQLLGFARRGKLEHRPVDMHAVIADTVELLSRTIDRRIEIRQDLAADSAWVSGDPGQLQQVMLNLMVNARDAISQAGRITVRTRSVAAAANRKSPGGDQPENTLEISVLDTGCGISREDQLRIFEPFFTTKQPGEGTGLGLATVFGIVGNHGGDIRVESAPGEGAAFTVAFPVAAGSVDTASEPQAEVRSLEGVRVLLVEDDEMVASVATTMLESVGCSVVGAEDGRAAVDVFERCPAAFDLVLLDMNMPIMDGAECFRRLLEIEPGVRAVLATGHAAEESARGMIESGLAGLIQKPYRIRELVDVLIDALGRDRP